MSGEKDLTVGERMYKKLGKILLDKLLEDLGKEVGDEKLKSSVYSFFRGVRVGMSLSSAYEEEDFISSVGVVFGYIFSDAIKKYSEKL
ncbi:MAG: hypothetical protein QMD12_00820 [Candidatus Aenigmarchaeota archaeon]|nr:hypothetical protein [Candidatus Aenigmarchaeota archaeon]